MEFAPDHWARIWEKIESTSYHVRNWILRYIGKILTDSIAVSWDKEELFYDAELGCSHRRLALAVQFTIDIDDLGLHVWMFNWQIAKLAQVSGRLFMVSDLDKPSRRFESKTRK